MKKQSASRTWLLNQKANAVKHESSHSDGRDEELALWIAGEVDI